MTEVQSCFSGTKTLPQKIECSGKLTGVDDGARCIFVQGGAIQELEMTGDHVKSAKFADLRNRGALSLQFPNWCCAITTFWSETPASFRGKTEVSLLFTESSIKQSIVRHALNVIKPIRSPHELRH